MANLHNQILPTGTRLGVYEIKEAIKIDVFDITYKGWNHHLKEWVEILEYFPCDLVARANDGLGVEVKSASDKEKFDYGFKAFLEQAEILTQIEHPNIVETENVLQFNGTTYRITAICEGLVLSRVVHSPASIADTELSYILESILNTLQKVHDHNIVHCGIHPDTIILRKDGEALLTGFAGGRVALAAHTAKLPDVLAAGFTAPELYQQNNAHRPASDFYALGATLYYCIFHKPPAIYQDRLVALSKGEPDPVSLSESVANQYSPVLLKAIEWMLRPGFNDRPQSAGEVLAFLKSAPTVVHERSAAAKDDSIASNSTPSLVKNLVWLGVAAGVISMIVLGFWFTKNTPEVVVNSADTVSNQPLSKSDQNQQVVPAQAKSNNSAALPIETKPSQPAAEIKINGAENQAQSAFEQVPQQSSAVNKPSQTNKAGENTALPLDQPTTKQAVKANILAKKETGKSQKSAKAAQLTHQPKKPKLPAKPNRVDSIEGYLAAAKKAMKEVRLTAPPGNNAYQYYQQVLAKDPRNREALAGKQKIVNRYAWVIRKSKADGDIEKAERVLKKAESVSPDDPKLQRIRAELQHQKK